MITVLYEDDRVKIARVAGQGYLQIDKTFIGTGKILPAPSQMPPPSQPMNQMFYGRPKEHPSVKLEPTSGH